MPAQQVASLRYARPLGKLPRGRLAAAAAAQRRRRDVEHGRAEDQRDGARCAGLSRARIAQQHPVPRVQRQRLTQRQPGEHGRLAGRRELSPFSRAKNAQPGRNPGGTDMGQHLPGKPSGPGAGTALNPHVHLAGQRPLASLDQCHAASRPVWRDAPQVECHAGGPGHFPGGLPEGLQ